MSKMIDLNSNSSPAPTPVTLTQEAAAHIQQILSEYPDALGLRLGIKSSGCSGYAYQMEVAHDKKADEITYEARGIALFIDPQNLPYLQGTELYCEVRGLNQLIKFKNPNIKGECGCGESFSLED